MKHTTIYKKIFEFSIISLIIIILYGINTNYFNYNFISTIITTILMIFNILRFMRKKLFNKIISFLILYRYLLYLIIFIICVSFKIHSSSMGIYNDFFKTKIKDTNNTLYGYSRTIRSDEYLVLTPYYLNQTYNNFNKINYNMSLSGQNMVIGYNAPVKDISLLFKPLNIGFVLLGREYGLSWYWCMKQILLFAFSFEMMYILTKKNKELSILGGVMIAYGPSTQWWFAPHMPDVILWSMSVFVCTYNLLASKKNWLKNILTLILPCFVTEFVIALFPSFQIGLGIFILLLLLSLIYRDNIKLFKDKKQIIRYLIVIILTLIFCSYMIYDNLDALLDSMNTVYPGSRISLGGNNTISDLLTDLTSFFLAYKPKITYSNLSEVSTYIHFGLFFILLSPNLIYKLKKEKDRDYIVGLTFIIILLIYGFFMIFGFPKWLAKVTLFSYINRMKMIFGIISVFYTVWSINALFKLKNKINGIYYILCILVYSLIYYYSLSKAQLSYLPVNIYIYVIVIISIVLLGLRFGLKSTSLAVIFGVVIVCGFPINPIVRGISDIENHPSARFIKNKISKDNNSYWIGYGDLLLQNYILANGGKALNAVNFYPDWDKWKILDEDNKYKNVYNRYAHIVIAFSDDDKVHIKKNLFDQIGLNLTIDKLAQLNVKYILTKSVLDKESDKYKLSKIYQDKDCLIYEIVNK